MDTTSNLQLGTRVMVLSCYNIGNPTGSVAFVEDDRAKVLMDEGPKRVRFIPVEVLAELGPTPEEWERLPPGDQMAFVNRRGIKLACMTTIADTLEYGFGGEDEDGFWTYRCTWYKPASSEAKAE